MDDQEILPVLRARMLANVEDAIATFNPKADRLTAAAMDVVARFNQGTYRRNRALAAALDIPFPISVPPDEFGRICDEVGEKLRDGLVDKLRAYAEQVTIAAEDLRLLLGGENRASKALTPAE